MVTWWFLYKHTYIECIYIDTVSGGFYIYIYTYIYMVVFSVMGVTLDNEPPMTENGLQT